MNRWMRMTLTFGFSVSLGAVGVGATGCGAPGDLGPDDPAAGAVDPTAVDQTAADPTPADPTAALLDPAADDPAAVTADPSTTGITTTGPCGSGFREQWSGQLMGLGGGIPIDAIACAGCGKMFVIAHNMSSEPASLSINNGVSTFSYAVPAADPSYATPHVTPDAANGAISICGAAIGIHGEVLHGCAPIAPQDQRYCDPYRDCTDLSPLGVDAGLDYGTSHHIYAVGPGTVTYLSTSTGWPGGTFIAYKLSAGPAKGKLIYLAENITPAAGLAVGKFVYNGTVIGTETNAYPYSESGWGADNGTDEDLAAYYGGFNPQIGSTRLGINYNQLLSQLGTHPTDVVFGTPSGSMPLGWPTNWATLISSWQ
jgi:hypothetical protein